MKILFSSDWQMTAANFDQIDQVVDQIETIHEHQGLQALIHCGDMKHVYNPLDGRVANKAIEIADHLSRKLGIPCYINLGNHDKYSMSENSQNWFPILEQAGFYTVDKPTVLTEGVRMFFMPYGSAEWTIEEMKRLVKDYGPTVRDSILVFHCGIAKARLNVSRRYEEEDAVPLSALYPEKFMACIGGHFHFQQELGKNAWFVGSPFPTDWGEANQKKGFLLLNTENRKITQIASTIPGFYDPKLKDFEPPKTWKGASVRITVPLEKDVENVTGALNAAKTKAEAKYKGALITVVPDFTTKKVSASDMDLGLDSGDHDAIHQWIKASIPDALEDDEAALTSYLLASLEKVSGMIRTTRGVKVLSLEAVNTLSFEHVKIDYIKPQGLRLITGENNDWSKRSNGSGKTTYIQLLCALWFGETLKGQSGDRLRRLGSAAKDDSWIAGVFELGNGRRLHVKRGRKPKGLRLWYDDTKEDAASGMGDRESQRELERLTGFTLETAANGIFIDQRELNGLLTGNDADRKKIFSSFLNLERYAKALVLIKEDQQSFRRAYEETLNDIRTAELTIEQNEGFLTTLREQRKTASDALQADLRKYQSKLEKAEGLLKQAKEEYLPQEKELEELNENDTSIRYKLDTLSNEIARLEGSLQAQTKLEKNPLCPTCKQAIDKKKLKELIETLRTEIRNKEEENLSWRLKSAEAKKLLLNQKEKMSWRAKRIEALKADKQELQGLISGVEKQLKRTQETKGDEDAYKQTISNMKRSLSLHQLALKGNQRDIAFVAHATKAFAKDGIPAWISGLACPRLNRAAAYYSKIFSDGEIEVNFALSGEDIVPEIFNKNGGETLLDQSNGETRIASLIVSFALRDVLSPINLIAADEPGEGLDEINARKFASGLLGLTERFSTIFITTHNPILLSELSDVHHVIITKKGRISTARMER